MKKPAQSSGNDRLDEARAAYRAGEFSVAEAGLSALLRQTPHAAQAWLLLGHCRSRRNDLPAAAEAYRQAAVHAPADFQPVFQLGCTLQELADHPSAVTALARARELDPAHPRCRCAMAISLARTGRPEEAAVEFQQAADLCAGSDPRILRQIAAFHEESGDLAAALRWAEQAVAAARPDAHPRDDAAGAALRARLLCAAGDPETARNVLEEARRRHPADAGLALALAGVYLAAGRPEEALTLARDATRAPGEELPAAQVRAQALEKLGRVSEAEEEYRQILVADPANAGAYQNYAGVLLRLARAEEAVAAAKRAVELNPRNRTAFSNFLFYLHYISAPTRDDMLRLHRQWAELCGSLTPRGEGTTSARPLAADRPLRVGFVSADFRAHAVAFFFLPLLQHNNPEEVTVFCYHAFAAEDAVTRQLQALCPLWRNISRLGTAEARALIRADGIEVLIDLGGHTAGNRLDLFAARSAPRQLSWLGYPDTTGLPQMDGRIVDAWAEPEEEGGRFSSERLYRLEQGFHCYVPPEEAPEVAPLPALAGNPFTFGSFNQAAKLSEECIRLWSGVLQRVPESRLLLKAHGLNDGKTQQHFVERFARDGVAPSRLYFAGATVTVAEHLACYAQVDLALDSFPYNGTTTTCESLWMGVPVLTLWGDRHCARMGASLLHSAGLPDWIAQTPEEFLRLAADHAADPLKLAAIRHGLRSRVQSSFLSDAPAFARKFTRLLQTIRAGE